MLDTVADTHTPFSSLLRSSQLAKRHTFSSAELAQTRSSGVLMLNELAASGCVTVVEPSLAYRYIQIFTEVYGITLDRLVSKTRLSEACRLMMLQIPRS